MSRLAGRWGDEDTFSSSWGWGAGSGREDNSRMGGLWLGGTQNSGLCLGGRAGGRRRPQSPATAAPARLLTKAL